MPTSSSPTSKTSTRKISASSRRNRAVAIAWALALVAVPPSAAAQALRLSGRVQVGSGPAARPLAGEWITLHQVTTSGGGPLDSVRSDAAGRYRLRVPRPDTAALYMVSAPYRGITYFTQAILTRDWPDTLPPLEVFDTSATAPAIGVAQRHVVIRRPADAGGRSVLEIVNLLNSGDRTRISPDSVTPVWTARLPRGATAFQVGEGDVSAEAVALRGDTVAVTAPIPPGQKQLTYTYVLPDGPELALPLQHPTGRVLVLLEDTAATLVEGPLTRRGVEVFDDTPFALFDGAVPADARQAVFRLTRRGISTQTLAIGVAVLAGLLMALAIPLLRRRAGAAVVAPAAETPDGLARAIAALDAAFEAGDRSPAAEAAHRDRRAALKARLVAAIARQRGGA